MRVRSNIYWLRIGSLNKTRDHNHSDFSILIRNALMTEIKTKYIPIDEVKAEITHELFMIEFDVLAEDLGFPTIQDEGETPESA